MTTKIILSQGPVDPFSNPVLCPTDSAGTKINAGRYGCSRDNGATWHGGTDLRATAGTLFSSIYSGKVTHIRDLQPTDPNYRSGVGNFIIVRSDDFSIKYCHLSEIKVAIGEIVAQGTKIGKTGKSGNAFNVPFKHLHIELSTDFFATQNHYVDPEPYLKTKYTNSGSIAEPSDTPHNPNSPNHANCPAFAKEELQELESMKAVVEKILDRGSWNADTSAHYSGGQVMHYKVKNVNILGTTITIDSNLDGSRSLIIPPLTTVDIRFSCFGVEPLGWKLDISTNSDAFIVTWELYSTWVPTADIKITE
ncbi:M23 family metallopeptidase [Flavobacterium xanthum]|uniref:Peptidase family M23 n=1 Tax=Flavobacterium xanthum TaxID=69322 RepID=A0A1M7LPF7_9FLAO|nr:M23 family metallopeptidase [Flavobacterium xanthum]SHM80138.1 Peptidase family M23 [Flavobacterium xanthum]